MSVFSTPVIPYDPDRLADSKPPEGFEPIVSHSPFGSANGPVFEKRTQDGWVRGFRVLPHHINAGGSVHGGMLMTFADILLAIAVMEKITPPMVTVRMTTDFIGRAVLGDWVEGTAVAVSPVDGTIAGQGEITAPAGVVASFQGIFKYWQNR